jgi:type IV secretory pathway TrbD component
VPVAIGALTTALLTLFGGTSTPVVVAIGLAAALLAFGVRILWLRSRR